nr:MAG TPA: hypothetical protein [Caudoviricetes sp.]
MSSLPSWQGTRRAGATVFRLHGEQFNSAGPLQKVNTPIKKSIPRQTEGAKCSFLNKNALF